MVAAAFDADPGFVWAMPDGAQRARGNGWLSARVVRYVARAGLVDGVGRPLEGVALWADVPGRWGFGLGGLVRAGLWGAPFALGPAALWRLTRLAAVSEPLHEAHAPRPHRYLLQLAVRPQCQGRGLGSALLKARLDEASARGLPCYLETFSERTLALYRRHGFQVVGEAQVPGGGPYAWGLLRAP